MPDDLNPFPSLLDDLEPVVLEDELAPQDVEQAEPYGFCWEFDFVRGDIRLTPGGGEVRLTGADTLRQWSQHVLGITKMESPIFDNETGTELAALFGQKVTDNYVIERVASEVESCLARHDRVVGVEVHDVVPLGSEVFVFVTMTTDEDEEVADVLNVAS